MGKPSAKIGSEALISLTIDQLSGNRNIETILYTNIIYVGGCSKIPQTITTTVLCNKTNKIVYVR